MSVFLEITSRENPKIKQAARLTRSGRFRKETGLFVAEGLRLCVDALESGIPIDTLFVTRVAGEKHPEPVSRLAEKAENAYAVPDEVFTKLTDTKSPQGILCLCRLSGLSLSVADISLSGKYLALENIADPSNLGAMARTAEALGVSGILLSCTSCDPYGPKALRAGMGSLFRVPLFFADDFIDALVMLRRHGMQLFAAVPDRAAEDASQLWFPPGSALLIGNEGNGLTEEAIAACGRKITIPMAGRAESLNAAAAAAILLWEMLRK